MSRHRAFFARSVARLAVGLTGLLALATAAVLTGAAALAPVLQSSGVAL